jgi:hypothetical protein
MQKMIKSVVLILEETSLCALHVFDPVVSNLTASPHLILIVIDRVLTSAPALYTKRSQELVCGGFQIQGHWFYSTTTSVLYFLFVYWTCI